MIRTRFVLTLFVVVIGLSSRGASAAPRASSPAPLGVGVLADVDPTRPSGGSAPVVATGEPNAPPSSTTAAAPGGGGAGRSMPSGTAVDSAATGSDGKSGSEPVSPLGAEGTDTAATAGVPMVDAAAQAGKGARYGLGVRARWVSVPSWMLGLFLSNSVPLSSYTIGAEFFRRSGNFDFVLGVAWQALSPPDGNWLGKTNTAATETDFVQFRGFGAVSLDAAFILRTELNEFVTLHYGGGVGIGITTGKMYRTSDFGGDCPTNPGDVVGCHPQIGGTNPCLMGPCTEAQLQGSQGGSDSPATPSRFAENRVPAVYPIVNLVTGLDFRIPNMQGFEFKLEAGFFFPYFFLGGGATYRI